MLAEDDDHQPITSPPFLPTVAQPTEPAKGRAINFTLEEQHAENGISPNSSSSSGVKKDFRDLSDVSMDDEEEDMQKNPIMGKLTDGANHTLGTAYILFKYYLLYAVIS